MSDPTSPAPTVPADPVNRMLQAYKDAVFAKDVDAFAALYADDVRVFDMWGAFQYDGLAAWRPVVVEWFGCLGDERVLVDFSDVRVAVDGRTAVGHGLVAYAAIGLDGGELRSLTNRLSVVLRRDGEGADAPWKIVHEHSSAPLDPATTAGMLQRQA